MNTKNIFKTLAVAMLMPAMLLTTACSSDNDLTNPNPENIIKKGYELPVTVSVTRQGSSDADATGNRASYNETSKKLEFRTGDKLFVQGSTSEAGLFAGELAYVSDGTFSGTITTEKTYSGTAAELFTVASTTANYIAATLLPAGYKSTSFLYIVSNAGYDDRVRYNYSNSFATSKTEGVEQLSYEAVGSYSGAFSLGPQNAILNFTITGLDANTEVAVVFSYGVTTVSKTTVSKNVTTDASGTATFAIGVAYSRDLNTCTLTVGGNAITLVSSSKLLYSGKIYNITRSAAPASPFAGVTAADLGKIIGADGNIYANATAASDAGTTAVAMIAYVGNDAETSTTYNHGLALALSDVSSSTIEWCTQTSSTCLSTQYGVTAQYNDMAGIANTTALVGHGSHTHAAASAARNYSVARPAGTSSWFLPSAGQWDKMSGTGGYGLANLKTTANGYTGLQSSSKYWSSSEYTAISAWMFYSGDAYLGDDSKANGNLVRACLAF